MGEFCQMVMTDCDPNPCQNQGTCSVTAVGHECLCPAGSTGVNCETDIWDDCKGRTCRNGGVCINRIGMLLVITVQVIS